MLGWNLAFAAPSADGAPAYAANPVNFDGTNDYLTRGATLTGAADSKLMTISVWVRRTRSAVTEYLLNGHPLATYLSVPITTDCNLFLCIRPRQQSS